MLCQGRSIQVLSAILKYARIKIVDRAGMLYSFMATAPRGGVNMFETLISLIIAPLIVGIVLILFDRWLDD